MRENAIYNKVLVVSPDYDAIGGMASIISSYRHNIKGLCFAKSNSRYGFLPGVFNLVILLFRMPLERLRGKKILHVHSASGKSFVRKSLIIRWGRYLGYKIIFHSHGGKMKEYVKKVGILKVWSTLKMCDVIIVLSQSWKEYFESTFHHPNIMVLNNTINMRPHSGAEYMKKYYEDKKIRFLFIGDVYKRKGVLDLVEAAKILKDDFNGRFEIIIGGGGELEMLKSKIKELNLEDEVKTVGWITGETKEGYLTSADVMVLPSYAEGMPVALLEGCAFALPAISTNVGGIPEIVKNGVNGILIEPGDVVALAKAMANFIENHKMLEEYSENALKEFAPFSIEEVKVNLGSIYKWILSR